VELPETLRAITPFGGLTVFFEFLGKIGYAEQIRGALPFHLTSPNAIDPVETYTAFLMPVGFPKHLSCRRLRSVWGSREEAL